MISSWRLQNSNSARVVTTLLWDNIYFRKHTFNFKLKCVIILTKVCYQIWFVAYFSNKWREMLIPDAFSEHFALLYIIYAAIFCKSR